MAGDLLPETHAAIAKVFTRTVPDGAWADRHSWADWLADVLADPAARAALAREWWRHATPDEHMRSPTPSVESAEGFRRIVASANRAAIAASDAPPGMEQTPWNAPGGADLYRLAPEDAQPT